MGYSYLSILLLMFALFLLVGEVFLPSGGLIAFGMFATLVASIFCAFQAWFYESPALWWTYVVSVALLLPTVLVGAFAIFPRTPFGRRFLLEAPTPEEVLPYEKEQRLLRSLIGRPGRLVTPHQPGGLVTVDGTRHHSETPGMMLDAGTEVVVVAVKGNRLVVRPLLTAKSINDSETESPDAPSELPVESELALLKPSQPVQVPRPTVPDPPAEPGIEERETADPFIADPFLQDDDRSG